MYCWRSFFRLSKYNRFNYFKIMEILIRDGRLAPLRWIQRSNAIRTFIFMSLSAFILDCLQTSGGKVFWLVKPSRRSTNELMEDKKENKKQCLHEYDCQSHLIQVALVPNVICLICN